MSSETQLILLDLNTIQVCCGGKCPIVGKIENDFTIKDDFGNTITIDQKYIPGIIEALKTLHG